MIFRFAFKQTFKHFASNIISTQHGYSVHKQSIVVPTAFYAFRSNTD